MSNKIVFVTMYILTFMHFNICSSNDSAKYLDVWRHQRSLDVDL